MGAQSFPASGFKKAQAERTKTATVDASTDDDDSSAAVQAGKGAVDERGRQIVHVDWERPYDPGNPQNWNNGKRWYLTLLASMWAFTTALCASAYSPLAGGLSKKYHVAKVVILLGNCTLQSSNSTADMFITPLSETVGRVPLYCVRRLLPPVRREANTRLASFPHHRPPSSSMSSSSSRRLSRTTSRGSSSLAFSRALPAPQATAWSAAQWPTCGRSTSAACP